MTSSTGFLVTFRRLSVAGLFCAAFAAGCNGESDDDGSSQPVAAGDFAQHFAVAYCTSIAGCCQRFGESFVQADCEQITRSSISAAIAVELASPNVVFDDGAAGRCIDAYSAALQACTDPEAGQAIDSACGDVFRGTVQIGGACAETSECAQPPPAEGDASCETGVCTLYTEFPSLPDLPPGAEGEACGGTCERTGPSSFGCGGSGMSGDKVCWVNDGLLCGADSTCQAVPTLGAACPDYYCAAGSYCDIATGICRAPQETGPCTDRNACTATSYCDYLTGQCAPLKPDGAACDSDEECQGGGCEGDRCRAWSVASAESCVGLFDD